MSANIKQYVNTCLNCHRVKLIRHKLHGQLELLSPAAFPFNEIMIDFITNLPPCNRRGQVFDLILVLVDRYTKMAMYISSRMDWEAKTMTDVVTKILLWKHNSLEAFISDRDSLFTAHYWEAFCAHLTIYCQYSIAFHPQTDEQTKQWNQILKLYLQSYINYQQDDWVNWLPIAEFAYNNSKHSSTGVTFFFAAYSRDPRYRKDFRQQMKREVSAARTHAEEVARMRKLLKAKWQTTLIYASKYYDKKHTLWTFSLKDKVWLNSKNIKTVQLSKKLDYKYFGSFMVLKPIEKQTYWLDLPKTFWRVHNIFHVFFLEPYKTPSEQEEAKPPSTEVDGKEHWEIKEVLNSWTHYGKLQYLVWWLGYPNSDNQ